MEFVAFDRDTSQFGVAHRDSRGVSILVQRSLDAQSLCRSDTTDEVDHHLTCQQRTSSPVVGDVTERPVLHLVPLARPWREVADAHFQPEFVSQPLQLHAP